MKTNGERTGHTPEGTIWTTRPMSPEVAAKYLCVHRGGIVACGEPAEECRPPVDVQRGHSRLEWIAPAGAKIKPYSPATPSGEIRPSLPPSVGVGLLDVFALARRRLDSLEPWPQIVDKAPRLSTISRGLANARFTRAYREFCQAVTKAGGQLAYPIAADPTKARAHRATQRKSAHRGTQTGSERARKARATRRARHDNGSAAALKAWATRRHKEAA